MKELSIFIDESGNFGEYDCHSPWYIVTMVFHEQDVSIQEAIEYLDRELSLLGLENHSFSKSEQIFFGSVNDLKRNYLKIVNRQDIDH